MRIDVVTIFPAYLAPLRLSLIGRAVAGGVLDLRVHDLRCWTDDPHRTVDDAPYGGGAGMVLRPEPWGRALDELVPAGERPLLVVPTPAGVPFTQAVAEGFARRPWLIFACGRYEGIDQRVVEHAAARMDVAEVSIGDYVLAGGEAAALVVVEAVARLLPGVVGNPDSLAVESHGADRLLEAPTYTRPPTWRGLAVPAPLLGGDHAAAATWRAVAARRRTVTNRPDLAHASSLLGVTGVTGEVDLRTATPADVGELLTLQRACWVAEAQANQTLEIPALTESLGDVRRSLAEWTTVVARAGGRLVGSVRGRLAGTGWEIGRLMVAPDLQGGGLGRLLLGYGESLAPPETTSFALFTGSASTANLRLYRKAGYRLAPGETAPGVVRLTKRRR